MRLNLPRAGATLAIAALSASAWGAPEFVPSPSQAYRDYEALEMPRSDVPVGALWVQDFGPTGDGAGADNLTTERSLSQVTISNDLQLSLTLGILNLFGLDPALKSRLSARFGDITIVRVKDMAKLAGPSGEPRIYEAIKAGTITITTESDIGLDLDTRASALSLPVTGRSDNGRRKSFSIDGRDMFIAFRVATLKPVRRDPEGMRLKRVSTGWSGSVGDRDFIIDTDSASACGAKAAPITLNETVVPANRIAASSPAAGPAAAEPTRSPIENIVTPAPAETASGTSGTVQNQAAAPATASNAAITPTTQPVPDPAGGDDGLSFPLRVPVADGQGGMLDRARVQARSSKRSGTSIRAALCTTAEREMDANVSLAGSRLEQFREPRAPRW